MSQIFVSYSRKDVRFVNRLIAALEQLGYSVWIDRESIVGGEAWMASISEGINQCEMFLIVLSPDAVASDNVARELTIAHEARKPRIPIRFNPYALPPTMQYQLAGVQWVDFLDHSFVTAMQTLNNALIQHSIAPAQRSKETRTTDSKEARAESKPTSLNEFIIGVWERATQAEWLDKPPSRTIISIERNGRFSESDWEGKWKFESPNKLILTRIDPNPWGGKIKMRPDIIKFEKMSQGFLEGISYNEHLGAELKTKESWHRTKA